MTAIPETNNHEQMPQPQQLQTAIQLLLDQLNKSVAITPQHIRAAMTQAFGADEATGAWDWRLGFDCTEAATWKFVAQWWEIIEQRAPTTYAKITMLAKISALLPTQSRRSEEQNELQQFSTPLELSYLAATAAKIRAGETVLEPSAGTGALAMHAKIAGANLILNEIAPARLGILELLFPDNPPTAHHAAYLHGLMANTPRPDVLLMNPPFTHDPNKPGHKSSKETLRHFNSAFQRLKPGGRAVIVTGATTTPAKLTKSENFDQKYHRFTATFDSSTYAKHGTRFKVALHVIDKGPDKQDGVIIEDTTMARVAETIQNLPEPNTTPPQLQTTATVTTLPTKQESLFTEDNTPAKTFEAGTALQYEPTTNTPTPMASQGIFQPWQMNVLNIPEASTHPAILAEAVAMAAIHPKFPNYKPQLPARLITDGVLSDAQLETIIYAGQAHSTIMPQYFTFDPHAGYEVITKATENAPQAFQLRKGYFLGDGTGTGKGRQAAGIILDNFIQGRTKAVWFSKSDKLIEDARRDWRDLGGKDTDITSLSKFRQGSPIAMRDGILFCTYATLRSGPRNGKKSRLDQIYDWLGPDFDGVIIFDEAHALAGAAGGEKTIRGSRPPSAQGVAGLALQNRIPKARIVYVSATGASSVNALAYASRLGLWSQPNIPFDDRKDFMNAMDAGGVAAAEIIARDLKVLGLYNARSLSYEGVEVDILETPLSDNQKEIYDEWAGAFHIIHNNLEAALESTGIVNDEGKTLNKNAKGAARSAFESTKQRFFSHLLNAMKCPQLFKAIDADIANGNAVIVQIVSTGESVMQRCLDRIPQTEWQDLSIDVTPREYVLDYLTNAFPTQMQTEYKDEDDNIKSKPLFDPEGNPVTDPQAEAMRDAMIERLASLPPMPAALDQIIWHYGKNTTAEITGRTRRIIKHEDGRMAVERRPASAGLTEANAFMNDEKQILIFSDAGGTGRSYHADQNAPNNRRRVHYLLEAGWRADAAIQGLGRSNRTNQTTPPIFRPVSTNVKGEKRFISTIARRLDTLGAITRGQRATANQGLFREEDNLESDYARAALRQFYNDLYRGRIEGQSILDFEAMTGLKLTHEGLLVQDPPPMHTFLNRLLALPIDTQNALFIELENRITSKIELAKEAGTYELGVEDITANHLIIEETQDIDPEHNLQLHYVKSMVKTKPYTMDELEKWAKPYGQDAKWMQNERSENVALIMPTNSIYSDDGTITPRSMIIRPNPSSLERTANRELKHSFWKPILKQRFIDLWEAESKAIPEFNEKTIHLVTGTLLPVWDKLPSEKPRIRRLTTDDGTVLLGRVLDDNQLRQFQANFGIDMPQPDPEDLFKTIMNSKPTESTKLAQNLRLRKRQVHKNDRIELYGNIHDHKEWLKDHGAIIEIATYRMEVYIPDADVLESIIDRWPLI